MPLEPEQSPCFTWEASLTANEAAGRGARFRVRPRLTVACWTGDVETASRITDALVDNAAKHGAPFNDGCVDMRLRVLPGTEGLHIEVDDADPEFRNFDAVTSPAHAEGRGLWWVKHCGGQLSWCELRDDAGRVVGKTVTARLRPASEGEPA
ncbi:hypothetical protein [Streptomyces sp. Caat 7-52]|uniref:hypothetical protein n=1 Tax=Streptomyces sp. Caat 7-52 TaxID=2949637 RepID=UPI0020360605|nr:hypothetical protein [Streptomyces sp. Caat 7-52]